MPCKPLMLYSVIIIVASIVGGCARKSESGSDITMRAPGTFGYDVSFLANYKKVIVLGKAQGSSRVLIVGDYQGRVMTSTSAGDDGLSYGWINYDLIRSGENKPHMNPFGGEDRFWLGPEGGQYALYFKPGVPFEFESWQTPSLIDTEAFDLVSVDSMQASFSKESSITNYQGFTFKLGIRRQIKLLRNDEIESEFGISLSNLSAVGFQSVNQVVNNGSESWRKKSGLISIWILGMFNPTDQTNIIFPFEGSSAQRAVTDNYFGAIHEDRLIQSESVVFLKADGKFRSKIGISPQFARPVVGSYSADKKMLTLVKYELDRKGDYVNSKWEQQDFPYKGDAVNAYNDGPLENGSQLGPFYELESSSPTRELNPNESILHRHTTLHLSGSDEALDQIAQKVFGIRLTDLPRK